MSRWAIRRAPAVMQSPESGTPALRQHRFRDFKVCSDSNAPERAGMSPNGAQRPCPGLGQAHRI
ncbi:protein of unknown function [Pararobbsia alpina]